MLASVGIHRLGVYQEGVASFIQSEPEKSTPDPDPPPVMNMPDDSVPTGTGNTRPRNNDTTNNRTNDSTDTSTETSTDTSTETSTDTSTGNSIDDAVENTSTSTPDPVTDTVKPVVAKCDEVVCLVEPYRPCCQKKNASNNSGEEDEPEEDLIDKPTRAHIAKGLKSVKGRLDTCATKHGVTGAVPIKLKISPAGRALSATATKGPGPFKNCVAATIKKARFVKSQNGLTVSYPVVFR